MFLPKLSFVWMIGIIGVASTAQAQLVYDKNTINANNEPAAAEGEAVDDTLQTFRDCLQQARAAYAATAKARYEAKVRMRAELVQLCNSGRHDDAKNTLNHFISEIYLGPRYDGIQRCEEMIGESLPEKMNPHGKEFANDGRKLCEVVQSKPRK